MSIRSFARTVAERGYSVLVVLRPSHLPLSREIDEVLQLEGLEVVDTTEPLDALARLCVLEQEDADRRAWGLARQHRPALLVTEREAWSDLSFLLAAVRRHVPEISVWIVDEDLVLEVHVYEDPATPRESGGPSQPPAGGTEGQPGLRLAGAWQDRPAESDAEPAAPGPNEGSPLDSDPDQGENEGPENAGDGSLELTPEELRMLLEPFDDGEPDDAPEDEPR